MKISSARAGMAVATAATLLAGVAATAAQDTGSTVTGLAVANQAGGLKVSGTAALAALEAVTIAEDPSGDSQLPGTDIVGGSITALGGGVTRFTMDIANMGPGGATVPAVVHHSWDLSVANGDKVTDVALKAINGGAVIAGSLDGGSPEAPSFAVQNCAPDPQTGSNTCTSTYVEGAYTVEGVSFDVPNTLIGLQSGSKIFSGENGMYTNFGASDVIWLSGPNGTEGVQHAEYVAPAGDVKIGIAPAGTAVDDVALTTTVPVKGKAYTATLAKPTAGSYVVVAQACHGGVCGPKVSKAHTVS